ncbi:APC family permease [Corynebacterium sp. Marseille-P4321]|uniref:APC family permease n=1 Tax=Corynebacterium sp. Marseille-P4321 TaxID=2736603 RepID=UPI00158BA625|nr:APC family permease [Corynebacterium sp. Marseille-P4321]
MANQQLNKELGTFTLIALGVSGVVGSSWIYTNGAFFDDYGAGGMIFGLAVGTLLAACVALSYAQLTGLFPRAGGEVVFSFTILGRTWGFVTGWLLIGAYVSSLAFYFTSFGVLLEFYIPAMTEIPVYSLAGSTVTLPVLLSGLLLTLLFFFLNVRGASLGGQLQVILFIALIGIGLTLAVVGFSAGSWDNFWPPFREDQNPAMSIMRFVVPGMTYMAGFGLIATLAEDANLPAKKIGRLVVATVLIAGSFYCIVLASSAFIMPWEEVAGMEQGTITAFTEAGFPVLGALAFSIAILGLLTSFLGLFMATSRIVVALARVNLLPARFAEIDPKYGTPKNALILVTIITIALGLLGRGAMTSFLDTGGIYLGLVWVLVVACQLRLKTKYPELYAKSKLKAGFIPVIGAAGAALTIILALWPGTSMSLVWPLEYVVLIAWVAIGAVFYFVSKPINREVALEQLLGEHKETLPKQLKEEV